MPQKPYRGSGRRTRVVGVRIEREEFEAIGRRLSIDGVTISSFLRRAVKRELERGQRRGATTGNRPSLRGLE